MRDDREGRRRLPDRLRERLAGRRADLAALLLPVGDQGARPLVGVLRGDASRDAHQPELARLLRLGRPRRLSYEEKLAQYRELADAYFQVDAYRSSATRSSRTSTSRARGGSPRPRSTTLLVRTVRATFPAHEHEHFVAHYRGLLGAWAGRQRRLTQCRDGVTWPRGRCRDPGRRRRRADPAHARSHARGRGLHGRPRPTAARRSLRSTLGARSGRAGRRDARSRRPRGLPAAAREGARGCRCCC